MCISTYVWLYITTYGMDNGHPGLLAYWPTGLLIYWASDLLSYCLAAYCLPTSYPLTYLPTYIGAVLILLHFLLLFSLTPRLNTSRRRWCPAPCSSSSWTWPWIASSRWTPPSMGRWRTSSTAYGSDVSGSNGEVEMDMYKFTVTEHSSW